MTVPPDTSGTRARTSATRARPTTAYPLPTRVSRALDRRQALPTVDSTGSATAVPDQQTSATELLHRVPWIVDKRCTSGSATACTNRWNTDDQCACARPTTAYPLPARVLRRQTLRMTLSRVTVTDRRSQLPRILFQHVCGRIVDKRCGRQYRISNCVQDLSHRIPVEHGHEPVRHVRGQLPRILFQRCRVPWIVDKTVGDDSTDQRRA